MNNLETRIPRYHSLLKWALLASVVIFLLNFVVDHINYSEYLKDPDAQPTFTLNKIVYQFHALTFWALLGLSIGKLKEGLITYGSAFVLVFIPSILLSGDNGLLSFLLLFLKFIPAVVFGFLVFKDKRKWKMIWLVLIIAGASLVNYSYDLVRIFSRLFRRTPLEDIFRYKIYGPDGDSSYREFNTLYELLQAMSLFLAFAASAWFLDRLMHKVKPIWRSFDLSVIYSTRASTAIFFISKWIILFGGLSLSMLVMQRGYAANGWMSNVRFSLASIEHILGLYAVVAFFRCFIVEFLLSRGYKIGWHLFWLWVPIIGEIVWIVNRLTDTHTTDVEQRIKNHKKAVIHYPEGVKIMMLFLAAISIGSSVMRAFNYGGDVVLPTLVVGLFAFTLLCIYLASDKTIYWILGITALGMIGAILFRDSMANMKFQYDNRISNINNVVLFMVLFHLKSFKVYPVTEGTSTKDNSQIVHAMERIENDSEE